MGVHVTQMWCPEAKETMQPIIVKASMARVVTKVSKSLKKLCAHRLYFRNGRGSNDRYPKGEEAGKVRRKMVVIVRESALSHLVLRANAVAGVGGGTEKNTSSWFFSVHQPLRACPGGFLPEQVLSER